MNYNTTVSSYKGYKEFFHELALEVIDFCEERKIDYHIKNGTMLKECVV
jgi:hypothetical protein